MWTGIVWTTIIGLPLILFGNQARLSGPRQGREGSGDVPGRHKRLRRLQNKSEARKGFARAERENAAAKPLTHKRLRRLQNKSEARKGFAFVLEVPSRIELL